MSMDIKNYMGGHCEHWDILYFFSKGGSLGSKVERTLGDVGKAPNCFLEAMRVPKRRSWRLYIIRFL
jgi:hypothetical protein